jgi:hypothetical protein
MPKRLLRVSGFFWDSSSLLSELDHDTVKIIATRRHSRGASLFLLAAFLILRPFAGAAADDFGTIDDGWLALETVSAEIRATVQAGNITALRSLYDQLLAVADGLAS